MTLTEQINEDIKTAMRAKETLTTSTLRLLRAAINIQESKQKTPLNDDQVIQVIRSEIKKRQDSIAAYEAGNRPDLVNAEKNEMTVLRGYLPAELSKEALEAIVIAAIAAAGATSKKDMGKVMKLATAAANNAVDGKTLSQLVQSALP